MKDEDTQGWGMGDKLLSGACASPCPCMPPLRSALPQDRLEFQANEVLSRREINE